jgi:cytidylate kinase
LHDDILPKPTLIAIDGPVATGKSVVGQRLARKLGYRFLDTGAMYRAVTWLAMERGVDPEDEAALTELASATCFQISEEDDQIRVDGAPIPLEEHRARIDQLVSLVSKIPGVRVALVCKQREIASMGGIVVAGRDIGTVVAPDAPVKLFLVASSRNRANRRHKELVEKGKRIEFAQVLKDLEARDKLDSERAHSPLRPARDAYLIDTDSLTVEQVMERALAIIEGE